MLWASSGYTISGMRTAIALAAGLALLAAVALIAGHGHHAGEVETVAKEVG